jgi:hypothetical protein
LQLLRQLRQMQLLRQLRQMQLLRQLRQVQQMAMQPHLVKLLKAQARCHPQVSPAERWH